MTGTLLAATLLSVLVALSVVPAGLVLGRLLRRADAAVEREFATGRLVDRWVATPVAAVAVLRQPTGWDDAVVDRLPAQLT
jgi:hypothetical protein